MSNNPDDFERFRREAENLRQIQEEYARKQAEKASQKEDTTK